MGEDILSSPKGFFVKGRWYGVSLPCEWKKDGRFSSTRPFFIVRDPKDPHNFLG